ncbi:MAG TPA: glycosyl hydrolase family 28-related protein [Chthoniobacteraceae bacterium]|nr:glycosyl hydrolase family 28-related protein [Chthoniobacteraceae bacterium]
MKVPFPVEAAFLNVRDHGAVGDGVADETEALQSAIDGAHQQGGGIVSVPAGY